MNNEVKDLVITFLKTDALLGLGTLFMALGVQVFIADEYLFSILFLVLSGATFFLRTFRKLDHHVQTEQKRLESEKK